MSRSRRTLIALMVFFPSLAMAGLCDTTQANGGNCTQTQTAQMQSGWIPSAFGETTDFRCTPERNLLIDWKMQVDLSRIPLPSDGSPITLLELSLDDEPTNDGAPVTGTDGAASPPVSDTDAGSSSSKGVLSLTLARSATGMRALSFTWREGDPMASVARLSRLGFPQLNPATLIEQTSGVWDSVDVQITPNQDWSSLILSVSEGSMNLIHHVLQPATGAGRIHVPRRLRTGLVGGSLTDGMTSVFLFTPSPGSYCQPGA